MLSVLLYGLETWSMDFYIIHGFLYYNIEIHAWRITIRQKLLPTDQL